MKGTFFQKPLQYSLDLTSEAWNQGSTIAGTLKLENHGNEIINIQQKGLHLCFGNSKKMKTKDKASFKLVQSIMFLKDEISAKESIEIDINFPLEENCPITDTTGSMQLVCGDFDSPFDVGILTLKVIPIKAIADFIEIFELFFKFKFSALKNKKDFIEAKVKAPDNKEWTYIQSLTSQMRVEDNQLETVFNFKLKKMSYETSGMSVKDVKLEIKETLTQKQYAGFGGSPNQEGIKLVISKILEQVRLKPVI